MCPLCASPLHVVLLLLLLLLLLRRASLARPTSTALMFCAAFVMLQVCQHAFDIIYCHLCMARQHPAAAAAAAAAATPRPMM